MPASEEKKARRKANRQKKRNLKNELINRIETGNTHQLSDSPITFEVPSGELFRGEFSSTGKSRGILTCGNNINKSLYLQKSFKAYAREVLRGKSSILEGELRESALKLLKEPEITKNDLDNFPDYFKEELKEAYNRHLDWIKELKPNKTVKRYYQKVF